MSMKESFSVNVKKEIIDRINSRSKADVCLMGLLTYCNKLSDKEISFLTENENVRDFFVRNVCRLLERDDAVIVTEMGRKNSGALYNVEVAGADNRLELLDMFRMDQSRRLTPDDLPKEKYLPQLIAGIFLACGSVTDPEKKYHMEFVMPTLDLCNDFGLLLIEHFGITPKHVERKNSQIVYIKESENIIDVLTIMGAQMASLEIMNVKMMKDVRNKINRAVNCDNANIEKTLRAAEKQLEDIELIDKTVGLDELTPALREMAELRYNNPDISLKELGTMTDPPISRSGVNHRLQKITAFADKIRQKKQL
ncbi:MAG: DNA-binding protein WhiA [Ruminococcus sp.]|nr:DNA-binding protein WhiA [Ruminococcus sp.]